MLSTEFGTKHFWRGFQVGCYTCHRGPSGGDNGNPNRAPVVSDGALSTTNATPAAVQLEASDADGDVLALRIVSQPVHGTVGLAGTQATYYPDRGFMGADTFTFAAWDGSTDSNLGTISVQVAAPPTPCEGDCNRSQTVTVDELLAVVTAALDAPPTPTCEASGIGPEVSVVMILAAVNNAHAGCP